MLKCKAHEWGEGVQRESGTGSRKKKRRHGRDCRKAKGNNSRLKKINYARWENIRVENSCSQDVLKMKRVPLNSELFMFDFHSSCQSSPDMRVGFAAGKWAWSIISSDHGPWTSSKHGIFVFGRITWLCCSIRGKMHNLLQGFFCFSHIQTNLEYP